jgi:general secretion pathway protein C
VASYSFKPGRLIALFPFALAVLAGVQSGRLLLALVTPQGPAGTPVSRSLSDPPAAFAGDFDPFSRAQAVTGSATITALPIKLHGTRLDAATGRGFAIIATPDGLQSSFAVGEVIMPGAKLIAVARDEVTIDRGGAKERLFLDQSVVAPPPGIGPASPSMPGASVPQPSGAAAASQTIIAPSSGEPVPAMPKAPSSQEMAP